MGKANLWRNARCLLKKVLHDQRRKDFLELRGFRAILGSIICERASGAGVGASSLAKQPVYAPQRTEHVEILFPYHGILLLDLTLIFVLSLSGGSNLSDCFRCFFGRAAS